MSLLSALYSLSWDGQLWLAADKKAFVAVLFVFDVVAVAKTVNSNIKNVLEVFKIQEVVLQNQK